jgi:uncharacterized delta-60 repeat protein
MKKILLFIAFLIFGLGFGQNLNPADRDPSFNQFSLSLNNFYIEGKIIKVLFQSDGKSLVLTESSYNVFDFVRLENNNLDYNIGKNFVGQIDDFNLTNDGKIIVLGSFTSYNGIICNSRMVRLNSDLTMDNTFVVNDSILGTNSKVFSQNDNKILISKKNEIPSIIRLNENGSIDATFNFTLTDHFSYFGYYANNMSGELIVQPDGKILAIFGDNSTLYRFNQNGSIDTTFFLNIGYINFAKLQNDGKILVCKGKRIERYNSDGTLDPSFDTGTYYSVTNSIPSIEPIIDIYSISIFDILIQPDNKIVIVGNFDKYHDYFSPGIVRLNYDGSIDTTFSVGSGLNNIKPISSPSANNILNDMIKRHVVIDNNNKLVCFGSIATYNNLLSQNIVRINSDGSKDTTFNNICKGFNGRAQFIDKFQDGKLIVAGEFYAYNGELANTLIKLNQDGSIDHSFNVIGYGKVNPISYYIDYIQNLLKGVKCTTDNKVYIYGHTGGFFNNLPFKGIMRLNADGSTDVSFNPGEGPAGEIYDLIIQDDGKIIVDGDFSTFNNSLHQQNKGIVRLMSDGSIDTSFSTQYGFRLVDILTNGKTISNSGNRLNVDGSIDTTYLANGVTKVLSIQTDGKVLIERDFVLKRLNADGSVDSSFSSDRFSNVGYSCKLFLIQPDQKYIIPRNNGDYGFMRLNNNGSEDTSFSMPLIQGLNFISRYIINSDGSIIIVGDFKEIYGLPERRIIKLKGNEFYSFSGNNKLDIDNNGCDSNDRVLPNLNLQVTSTTNNLNYISNTTGNHQVGLTAGNYTITPVLENPTYFTASPTSVSVNFPTQVSPVSQNFCITPNGIHPDLEVTLLPLNVARPGFQAKYKLVYKNKGNQLQSGTVNFNFNDAVLNFVSATTGVSSQTLNNLNWNFTNLNPFETKEIVITLLINTPTVTPPVNSGFVLNYTTTISSTQTDEMPSDNTFVYNQTVVNSFDPNDKTCLEGATIATTKVGDYIHYMIRFENTGTYNAQNITVKDVIDTTKFDINSIVPTSGSGLFITRVLEGNRAEFYFENINLPFAVGTNTGYVAFKIKTKATLVAGDSFSNKAGIYFDYNSAITTNTATTSVQNPLVKEDFTFENYFSLYPNPVSDLLNINKKNDIAISSINIFNSLGQLVLVIPNAKETQSVDVSTLQSGNYFVKINSDRGTATTKFIKM